MLTNMRTTILTVADIDPLLERVQAAAKRTTKAIATLIGSEPDCVEVFRRMKFEKSLTGLMTGRST